MCKATGATPTHEEREKELVMEKPVMSKASLEKCYQNIRSAFRTLNYYSEEVLSFQESIVYILTFLLSRTLSSCRDQAYRPCLQGPMDQEEFKMNFVKIRYCNIHSPDFDIAMSCKTISQNGFFSPFFFL